MISSSPPYKLITAMEKVKGISSDRHPSRRKASNLSQKNQSIFVPGAMKKLYGKAKGKVHPSPPVIADRLSLLPATILTLAAALSPEDKQVLAYLISCSGACPSTSSGRGGDHRPQFHCNCFSCYMSYWVRWDSSPNRQLIHEILDAYEEGLFKKRPKAKKERGKRVCISPEGGEKSGAGEAETAEVGGEGEGGGQGGEVGLEKGPVRKLVSFIGERIWGVWGI